MMKHCYMIKNEAHLGALSMMKEIRQVGVITMNRLGFKINFNIG